MEDPLLKGWIDKSRTEARRTLEGLPLDAPEKVSVGLRAYLQAILKLEEELRGFVQMGQQEERRMNVAPEIEDE